MNNHNVNDITEAIGRLTEDANYKLKLLIYPLEVNKEIKKKTISQNYLLYPLEVNKEIKKNNQSKKGTA